MSHTPFVSSSFNRYKRLTSVYLPEFDSPQPALSSHKELHKILKVLKEHPKKLKEQLIQQHFGHGPGGATSELAAADQERAFNLAASVLLALNCGVPGECADTIGECNPSLAWDMGTSLNTFIKKAFGPTSAASGHGQISLTQPSILKELTAKRLKDKAGLRFEVTDDIHSHLRLDSKAKIVYVFGYTAVLEEFLLATMTDPDCCLLPRSLIFEILYTIYQILSHQVKSLRVSCRLW
jgi:hypothetical protein